MRLLQRAVVGGGAIVAGGVLLGGFRRSRRGAVEGAGRRILNLVLLLEEMEAAFYADAEAGGALRGELAEFARIVGEHERAHVAFLRKALGKQAEPKPTFDFGNTTRNGDRFAATAAMLEDTAVAAYNGQAANLTKPVLKAAATIVSVEARHAAWIRDIVGQPASPQATDTPATEQQVREAITHGLREGGRMIPELPPELDLSLDQLDRDGALHETASGFRAGGSSSPLQVRPRCSAGRVTCSRRGAEGRRRDSQLCARARVPSGGLLHRDRAARGDHRESRARRWSRRCRRARPRIGVSQALGTKAIKRPTFDFRGTTENQQAFLKTAVAFEDLAVAAYKGQAHLIKSDAVLAAAVSIHSVEARHAAWMRHLFGIRPAVRPFDEAKSKRGDPEDRRVDQVHRRPAEHEG